MTREEAIQEFQNVKDLIRQDGKDWFDERDLELIDMAIEALSTDTDGEDLIIKGAKGIQDGLYNIQDGKLFKYKAKGGTVRTYPIVPSADAEPKVKHDREWIIGCIKHDGFIKTDRFDKANQIILDALSAEAKTKCVAQIKVDTEEVARRIKEEYDITDGWIPCSERLPKRDELVLVTYKTTDRIHLCRYLDDGSENPWWSYIDDCCAWNNVVLAWMPLPEPYREDGEV